MTALELITESKWERALFTSYALSLSFFESRLLKEGVVRNGCRFIDVLADVDGYAMTLHERQSSRVGVDYRLVPIALEEGVFHPKLTLLSGAAGDLLLVGSGNLTLYGYGRNLEVVDILPLARHPGIAADLSSFLSALSTRKDMIAAEIRCLDFWRDKFATEAKRAAPPPSDRAVRLVHSVTRSIGEQLVELAQAIGPVGEIRRPINRVKADQ